MGATKEITPKQYAKWKGCHISLIHRYLLNEEISKMEFVIKVRKYSRFYTLEVPSNLTADSFKTISPK